MNVYFIRDEHDRVKIGSANDPEKCRRQLQRGNADRLEVVRVIKSAEWCFALETWLHERFREYRLPLVFLGRREWFHYREEMMSVQPPPDEVLEGIDLRYFKREIKRSARAAAAAAAAGAGSA